jgi:sugar/nucleoside kinase (ribokinase family)
MLDLDTLVLGDIAPLFDLYPSLLRRHGALLAAAHDHPTHWSPRWTAAGDRFNAGYCLGLLTGGSAEDCLILGSAVSGFFVRKARSPSRTEVVELLHQWAEGHL